VGLLRKLDSARLAAAASIAAGLGVAASRQTLADGATLRNVYTGLSGRSGFLALDLEASGITGERDPLASVFGRIYGEAFAPDLAVAGLGREWRLLRNYFKLHPSARYVHSAIDLLDALRAAHGALPPAAIAGIEFETYAMAATMDSATVTSAFGTRFSIPFALAARLHGADAEIGDGGEAAFERADIHRLARLVTVRESAAFSAAYPDRQPSRMRIVLQDGRRLEAEADHIRGEAELPHPEAALRAKFLTLTTPSLGRNAGPALDALLAIEDVTDIHDVTRLLATS
jgi:2-methylcitrate dehydratase PrpD